MVLHNTNVGEARSVLEQNLCTLRSPYAPRCVPPGQLRSADQINIPMVLPAGWSVVLSELARLQIL